jgi:predicted GNAT family acetyltransferase
MSLSVQRLSSDIEREACIRWLARHPIEHLMLLGDLYPPLIGVSEIFVAIDDGEIVGVGNLFRGFSTPSVILSESAPIVQRALLATIHQQIEADWLTICPPASFAVFCQFERPAHVHTEQQMLLQGKILPHLTAPARLFQPHERDLLDQFYKRNQRFAWTPLMFEMGPYYGVWRDEQVVAAAGIHFVTPYIAQVGNVFTHPDFRGKGFATATTAAVAYHLQQMEIPIISLFVTTDNLPAIRIYEKLGFAKEREIVFAHFETKGNLQQ